MSEKATILNKCKYHSYFQNFKYYDFVDRNIFGSLLNSRTNGEMDHFFMKVVEESFELTIYDIYVVYKDNTDYAHKIMRKMICYETKEVDTDFVTICKEVIYLN